MGKHLHILLLLIIIIIINCKLKDASAAPSQAASPYLTSQSLFLSNYQSMIGNFKIFAYQQQQQFPSSASSSLRLFHSSLLNSSFLTPHPHLAHLFYLPFSSSSSSSARATSRLLRDLRSRLPYWNRTLGADHFYLSSGGSGPFDSSRHMVELAKNSLRLSASPTSYFIPHKDILLPPPPHHPTTHPTTQFLFQFHNPNAANFIILLEGASGKRRDALVSEFTADPDFHLLPDHVDADGLRSLPRFRLFDDSVSEIGEALRRGWVPLILMTHHRPVLHLPFADLLNWSQIAVVVGAGVTQMKEKIASLTSEELARMKEAGEMAAPHFVWNPPQPYDAFHTLLYHLWLRRHLVRYPQRTSLPP